MRQGRDLPVALAQHGGRVGLGAQAPFQSAVGVAQVGAAVGEDKQFLAIGGKLQVEGVDVADLVFKLSFAIGVEDEAVAGIAEGAEGNLFAVGCDGNALGGQAVHGGERRAGVERARQVVHDELRVGRPWAHPPAAAESWPSLADGRAQAGVVGTEQAKDVAVERERAAHQRQHGAAGAGIVGGDRAHQQPRLLQLFHQHAFPFAAQQHEMMIDILRRL